MVLLDQLCQFIVMCPNYGEIKLVAKQGLEMSLDSALALERGGIFRLFETADAKEGLAAFAEKRKPSWKGE